MATPRTRYYPPPDHPAWNAFYDGYLAGITDGISMGRAQVEAEEWPIWQQFINQAHTLANTPGPLGHHHRETWIRERQHHACWNPGLTPHQIIEKAHWSWGLATTTSRIAA